MPLITFTDKGLYCPAGDFYIDPWKPVKRAVITHAHSDHARWGNDHYLAHHHSIPLLQSRLGEGNYQGIEWDESLMINDVKISLHPAGHMIGSSQVKLEYKGEVWVVSGDYKLENDGISGAFEPVRCHSFITESTFGLPIYTWKKQEEIFQSIQSWILHNKEQGKASVLLAYSLGKAQRLLPCLQGVTSEIYAHGAIFNAQETLKNAGWQLPPVHRVIPELSKDTLKGAVVLAPPSAANTTWMKRFGSSAVGICSGWMQVRGNVRRKNADAGFVLSDHADWPALLEAVKLTGAERVFVTHGFQSVFSRYLNEQGLMAAEVKTEYGEEEDLATITEPDEEAGKDTTNELP